MTKIIKHLPKIANGRYVVAVSGGVDSMVLIDLLKQIPGLDLIIAHVDHGIRDDSGLDYDLVQNFAQTHNLKFEGTRLMLGGQVSEAQARTRRYDFLQKCCIKHDAKAIITGHHQDDLVETALIAIMRGTGWRGLAPFYKNSQIIRPLISLNKDDLLAYARRHKLNWHEDSTNLNEKYLRNYIRHSLIPMLNQCSDTWRDDFLQLICKQQSLRAAIEPLLHGQHTNRRYNLIMMQQTVAYEVLQSIMRRQIGGSLQRQQAQRVLLFIKSGKPKKVMPLNKNWQLRLESANFIVEPRAT